MVYDWYKGNVEEIKKIEDIKILVIRKKIIIMKDRKNIV